MYTVTAKIESTSMTNTVTVIKATGGVRRAAGAVGACLAEGRRAAIGNEGIEAGGAGTPGASGAGWTGTLEGALADVTVG